jgi:hypothetical protein
LAERDLDAILASARRGLSPAGPERKRVRARVPVFPLPALKPGGDMPSAFEDELRVASRETGRVLGKMSVWAAAKAAGVQAVIAASLLGGASFGFGYVVGRQDSSTADGANAHEPAAPDVPAIGPFPRVTSFEPAPPDEASGPATAPETRPGSATSERAQVESGSSAQRGAARALAPAPSVVPPRTKRRGSDASLERELRLLQRVERALRHAEPRLASALLDELDAQQPHARLGTARAAARILVNCQLEPSLRAAQAADEFLRAHPESMYAERIRALCERKP